MESNDHFMESSLNCSLFKCELIKIFAPLATKYDHSLLHINFCLSLCITYFSVGFYHHNVVSENLLFSCLDRGLLSLVFRAKASLYRRGVARGEYRGARAPPPEFGRSVNPIQTRGDRLCPSHYCQPPRIQKAIYTSAVYRKHWSINSQTP